MSNEINFIHSVRVLPDFDAATGADIEICNGCMAERPKGAESWELVYNGSPYPIPYCPNCTPDQNACRDCYELRKRIYYLERQIVGMEKQEE